PTSHTHASISRTEPAALPHIPTRTQSGIRSYSFPVRIENAYAAMRLSSAERLGFNEAAIDGRAITCTRLLRAISIPLPLLPTSGACVRLRFTGCGCRPLAPTAVPE